MAEAPSDRKIIMSLSDSIRSPGDYVLFDRRDWSLI